MPDEREPFSYSPVAVDHHVPRLEVVEALTELEDGALDVDHQPHEMRRIEVEADGLLLDSIRRAFVDPCAPAAEVVAG